MYSIGKFAQMCKTTIKTLRFYDSMGVLKPDYIDKENGYRYYESSKIIDYYRIVALKAAGFTIPEISETLRNADDAEILSILEAKENKLLAAYEQCKDLKLQYKERLEMNEYAKTTEVKVTKNGDCIILQEGNRSLIFRFPENDIDGAYEIFDIIFSPNTSHSDNETAKDQFDAIYSLNTQDTGVNFYGGRCLASEGYQKALSELLEKMPDNGNYKGVMTYVRYDPQNKPADMDKEEIRKIYSKCGKPGMRVSLASAYNSSSPEENYVTVAVLAFK